MVPIDHARLSARDFGGDPLDYLELHEFLDSTKFHCEDFRHRAILHNTFGLDMCERIFGPTIVNSDGNGIPTRELARRHIREDCGCVPTIKEWLDALSGGYADKFNSVCRRSLKWLKETFYKKEKDYV